MEVPIRSNTFQIGTIKMSIGANNWDLETYKNKLEKGLVPCPFQEEENNFALQVIIHVH